MPAFGFHHAAQGLNLIAINRPAGHDHFETVVVLGVVAAGDLNATAAQSAGRKIQHGCGDSAHVNDRHTGCTQAAYECSAQGRAAEPAIATHCHRVLALCPRYRAKGLTQCLGQLFLNARWHYAPNVISLEDRRGHMHERVFLSATGLKNEAVFA